MINSKLPLEVSDPTVQFLRGLSTQETYVDDFNTLNFIHNPIKISWYVSKYISSPSISLPSFYHNEFVDERGSLYHSIF